MTRTFSTGVQALDRKLDGGIPAGTLVALLAEPASQAGLLISELAAREETVYLSSERSTTAVTAALREQQGTYDDVTVTRLDRDAPVIDAIDHVEDLPEESLCVVDPVEPLERTDPGQFRTFLDRLRSALARTDSIAVLHALEHGETPSQRYRTTYASDLVFEVVTDASDEEVETRLLVPKFRGGRALTDAVRLELTDTVRVDTSRDIA